jgi:hypothetical protein
MMNKNSLIRRLLAKKETKARTLCVCIPRLASAGR